MQVLPQTLHRRRAVPPNDIGITVMNINYRCYSARYKVLGYRAIQRTATSFQLERSLLSIPSTRDTHSTTSLITDSHDPSSPPARSTDQFSIHHSRSDAGKSATSRFGRESLLYCFYFSVRF